MELSSLVVRQNLVCIVISFVTKVINTAAKNKVTYGLSIHQFLFEEKTKWKIFSNTRSGTATFPYTRHSQMELHDSQQLSLVTIMRRVVWRPQDASYTTQIGYDRLIMRDQHCYMLSTACDSLLATSAGEYPLPFPCRRHPAIWRIPQPLRYTRSVTDTALVNAGVPRTPANEDATIAGVWRQLWRNWREIAGIRANPNQRFVYIRNTTTAANIRLQTSLSRRSKSANVSTSKSCGCAVFTRSSLDRRCVFMLVCVYGVHNRPFEPQCNPHTIRELGIKSLPGISTVWKHECRQLWQRFWHKLLTRVRENSIWQVLYALKLTGGPFTCLLWIPASRISIILIPWAVWGDVSNKKKCLRP